MIITLKGCTATAFIGGLNFYSVSKGTVSGATVTITTSTISKDAATSTSARDIATVALNSGYENLVVTVTMGGTTVNWYAGGKVTIPANTEVTGTIKISASATLAGGGDVVDPEEPGAGETQYYTLTHGNDYNASFVDSKTRVSIQPYTITVPTGVTITPKTGYLWAWMNNVDPDNMPSGSGGSWCEDTYTGTGKQIGITFKKSDDSEFDFSVDSIYASDYFDVSDSSIWIVDNSTSTEPSTPSEPSEPSGENTDLSTLTLQHGNPFGTTEQQTDTTRANSTTNAYLLEGTTISLKDNTTYKWALKKVTSETGKTVDSTFNSGKYVPDSVWTTKKSYTIIKSGYYCIILLKSDNSAFDWSTLSNIVSNYFELS